MFKGVAILRELRDRRICHFLYLAEVPRFEQHNTLVSVISMIKGDTADRLSLGPEDRLRTLIAVSACHLPEQLFGHKDRIFR